MWPLHLVDANDEEQFEVVLNLRLHFTIFEKITVQLLFKLLAAVPGVVWYYLNEVLLRDGSVFDFRFLQIVFPEHMRHQVLKIVIS